MTKEEIENLSELIDLMLDKCILADSRTKVFKRLKEVCDLAIKALEQDPILDKIRADIIMYEGDCRLAVDEYPSCKQCTDNVFETIYGFFDKYKSEIPTGSIIDWNNCHTSEQLKSISTTKNDLGVDAISRKAVDRLAREYLRKPTDENIAFYEHFLELPLVTPIRPKGHWIEQNDDYFDWYECSECGYGSEGEMQYSSEYDVRTNYCPCCGADMRGVKK